MVVKRINYMITTNKICLHNLRLDIRGLGSTVGIFMSQCHMYIYVVKAGLSYIKSYHIDCYIINIVLTIICV